MDKIAVVGRHLLESVRAMDNEATTLLNGHHAGIFGYRAHVKSKRRKYEDVWSERLVALLKNLGLDAYPQSSFPKQRSKKCDITVRLADRRTCWIEVKPAWKGWFDRKTSTVVRRNTFFSPYLFGPLKPGLVKSHSAAQDFVKLDTFAPSEPAGFLLIGFDTVASPIDGDVAELATLANLSLTGWHGPLIDVWADKACDQCRISAWFWYRGAISP